MISEITDMRFTREKQAGKWLTSALSTLLLLTSIENGLAQVVDTSPALPDSAFALHKLGFPLTPLKCAYGPDYLLPQDTVRAVVQRAFAAAGLTWSTDHVWENGRQRVLLDGFDPTQGIGYLYISGGRIGEGMTRCAQPQRRPEARRQKRRKQRDRLSRNSSYTRRPEDPLGRLLQRLLSEVASQVPGLPRTRRRAQRLDRAQTLYEHLRYQHHETLQAQLATLVAAVADGNWRALRRIDVLWSVYQIDYAELTQLMTAPGAGYRQLLVISAFNEVGTTREHGIYFDETGFKRFVIERGFAPSWTAFGSLPRREKKAISQLYRPVEQQAERDWRRAEHEAAVARLAHRVTAYLEWARNGGR